MAVLQYLKHPFPIHPCTRDKVVCCRSIKGGRHWCVIRKVRANFWSHLRGEEEILFLQGLAMQAKKFAGSKGKAWDSRLISAVLDCGKSYKEGVGRIAH